MFDFGFWELIVVLVVALLVVGPDKLPGLAAQAGRWVGKARRMIQSVRLDIENEIKAAELQEMLDKQQNEIRELKSILTDSVKQTAASTKHQSSRDHDDELLEAIENQIEQPNQTDIPDSTKRD